MNLYRISQTVNDGYDTYDSAIVAAPDEATARKIHPSASGDLRMWVDGSDNKDWIGHYPTWAPHPDAVTATLIGIATASVPMGTVLASFNAG
ncbi:hypothetical protein [Methylobacterium fujisawaense]|uniref:hypothetical protein n=1 Tax=Methylobacterium fujisawaense TaxID=107400 RepID=UPI00313F261E